MTIHTAILCVLFILQMTGSVYFGAIKGDWTKGSYFAIHAAIDLLLIIWFEGGI